MKLKITSLLGLCTLYTAMAQQPGTLDTSFTATGANLDVNSVLQQPDGKILISGNFMEFNGESHYGIVRLNLDGTIDTTFDTGTGPLTGSQSGGVFKTIMQPDGKIIIGGYFYTYDNNYGFGIARINSDGSYDNTFQPLETPSYVNGKLLVLQPDGKLLVAGAGDIARLTSNGSYDTTFNTGTNIDSGEIKGIALQPDGKIIINGSFNSFNGTPSKYLARLNSDGTVDTSFNIGTSANGIIQCCHLLPDGKILIGGSFMEYNDVPANRMARLNTDGSLDTTFAMGTGSTGVITKIIAQPNGKILIAGFFTTIDGENRNKLAQLNSNGSLDTDFAPPGTGIALTSGYANIHDIYMLQDRKIMIAGDFNSYDNATVGRVARLYGPPCATPAPAGESIQTISETFTEPATIEDITITPNVQGTVQWYASEADIETGSPIVAGTELENGMTYYAIQTIGDCPGTESLAVTVNVVLGSNDFNADAAMRFYPNPARETLTVSAAGVITGIKIYNPEGRLLMDQPYNAEEATVNLAALAAGTYIVSAATSDGVVNRLVVNTKN